MFRYDQIDEHGRIFQADNMTSPNFRANLMFEVIHPTTKRAVPTPRNGWRYSQAAMNELIGADKVIFGPDEITTPRLKRFLDEQGERVPYATFTQSRMPGSKRVEAILGDRRFPNPKDHEVIMRWLSAIAPKDGVILDFFGGSGTTAEAVMRLNDGDGGTRQCILVTNNELGAETAARLRTEGYAPGDPEWEGEGVFRKVTRPRIETVVSGKRPDGSTYSEGLRENVAFYKLTYEDESLVALGHKFDAIAPLLWLKAGGIGSVVRRDAESPWSLPEDAQYGILFQTSQAKVFGEALALRQRSVRHVFIVSDSESAFQAALEYLPTEQRLGTTRLYSDYLHSFEINGKG